MAELDQMRDGRVVAVRADGFSFAYPGQEDSPVLEGLSFEVVAGAYCVITGPTGCGKTTLLRCLKPELAPAGTSGGRLEVLGRTLTGPAGGPSSSPAPDQFWSATNIGFVMQDPAAQIVCDTVWHELAFGLENIGMPQAEMRRRIAEVAHFFGIEPLLHRATETLSGGQQQLVNLAAVLALRPQLLVLDEPTAQLDPNAQREFLFMLGRVNRELGTTVVMATHTPEAADAYATQHLSLGDETPLGTRKDLEARLTARWHAWESGRAEREAVLTTRDLHVRYGRDEPWVLRGIDLTVVRGSVHVIVGGNGCGKSTLLKALAGILSPERGHVENALAAHQAYLPQDPRALLVCDTVAEEFAEWSERCGYTSEDVDRVASRLGLAGLENRDPNALSGGQRQKLALAKLLLTKPDLLFLDEPTKGLDPEGTAEIIHLLRAMAADGRTVVMVTHDLDVALAVADEVSMVFDGELACTEPARAFFAENLVYRPNEASRLFGALLDDERAADARAGATCCSGPDVVDGPTDEGHTSASKGPTPNEHVADNEHAVHNARSAKTVQHRTLVEACALIAVPVVLAVAALTGFSQTALLSFVVVIAAIAVFFASYETGAPRLREIMPTVVLAAVAAAGRVIFAGLPSFKPVSAIAIIAGITLGRRSGFMVGALAALASNFFFGQGSWTPWQMYAWGLVGYGAGVLAQLGLFGERSPVESYPSTSAQSANTTQAANAAQTAERTPDAGEHRVRRARLRHILEMVALCLYGFVASIAYGWILNAWSILGFLHAHIGFQVLAVYASSLPFDVVHGISTVIFLLVLYVPWRRKIERIVRRYGL